MPDLGSGAPAGADVPQRESESAGDGHPEPVRFHGFRVGNVAGQVVVVLPDDAGGRTVAVRMLLLVCMLVLSP